MNTYRKILGLCLLQILFFGLKAQKHDILKSFINKNDIALRSVQKQAIKAASSEIDAQYLDLLAIQISSVDAFSVNPEKSAELAYFVRKKCKEFLEGNAKTSTDYLLLNEKENKYFANNKSSISKPSLESTNDLQKLRSMDIKDPHVFESLKTRID